MFKVNDVVISGSNGVCKIVGIEEKAFMGKAKTYYVLKSLNDDRLTCYIPVDNELLVSKIRRLISKEEINKLIDSIPDEKAVWIENKKERKEAYKKMIAEGNHSELIGMIKAIYFEKKDREINGKRLHISDEQFLKDAKSILFEEFKYVLNLSEEEMLTYMFSRIKKHK